MSVPLSELLGKLQRGAKAEGQNVKVINTTTGTSYDISNTVAIPSVITANDGTILIQITIPA